MRCILILRDMSHSLTDFYWLPISGSARFFQALLDVFDALLLIRSCHDRHQV